MELISFFNEVKEAAIAFSGGVDSSFLLYAAKRFECNARAYFVKTQFQPEFELDEAVKFAESLDMPLTMLSYDILAHEEIARNSPERCYYCKSAIMKLIFDAAARDGYSAVLDGTNASDDALDRPGMKAIHELGVRSPLRECGLTKKEIRALLKAAKLSVWNKPAYSCLATRVPFGTSLSETLLSNVEDAENALFDLGFSDFRARVCSDGTALLQFTGDQLSDALDMEERIVSDISPYFRSVRIDRTAREKRP